MLTSLESFINQQAAKTASAAPAAPAAPVAAAPVAAAPTAPAKVAAAPAPAPAPAAPQVKVSEAQTWCKLAGFGDVPDAAANVLFQQAVEAEKTAEAQVKQAAVVEMESRGILQYHGQAKEACALRVAMKTASQHELFATAAMTGCHPSEIIKRASEIAKSAEIIGSQPDAGWYTQFVGSGANPADSALLAAAQSNQATTEYRSGASAGTRQPVTGVDGKLLRFEDTVVIPNSPGVAAAGIPQPTSNGRG